jgi:hypothetical protein
MAKRHANRYRDLAQAVLDGTADDVSRILAGGTDPDSRGEADDPTPLMIAAARGSLQIVERLVAAGADVNAQVDDQSEEMEQFPFLDELYAAATLHGLFPLAYAALYRQQQVYDYLAPRTAAELRKQAEAIRRGASAAAPAVRAYGEPAKQKSASKAAREKFLAEHAKARRWVNVCLLCGRQGYKPDLPDQIDGKGSAAELRRLFTPLAVDKNQMCEKCLAKVNLGLSKARAKWQSR